MNLKLVTVMEFIRQYFAEDTVVVYKVFLFFSSTVNRIWSTDSEEVLFHTG